MVSFSSTAADLLKQVKHKVCYDDDMPLEAFLDEVCFIVLSYCRLASYLKII